MQMWFAALGAEGEWFNNLLRRIAEGSPSVSALLDTSALKASLGGRLPAVLRISEYRYFFEKQQQHGGGGGAWWRRELVAQSQPISAARGVSRPPVTGARHSSAAGAVVAATTGAAVCCGDRTCWVRVAGAEHPAADQGLLLVLAQTTQTT